MKRFRLARLTPLLALLMGACGSLPAPSGRIAGRDAAQTTLVMKDAQHVTISDGRKYDLPAGRYRGMADDEEGVYFEAPGGVVVHDHFFGAPLKPQPRTGGVYLPREEPQQPRLYSRNPSTRRSELDRIQEEWPKPWRLRRGESVDFTLDEAR